MPRWAANRNDVLAVALVGSWARGEADVDSDIDLVLLVEEPESYLADDAWASGLGASVMLHTRSWGAVTERRFALDSGRDVDVGIARRCWASVSPVDAGTARVVRDGFEILFDPHGLLAGLAAAVRR